MEKRRQSDSEIEVEESIDRSDFDEELYLPENLINDIDIDRDNPDEEADDDDNIMQSSFLSNFHLYDFNSNKKSVDQNKGGELYKHIDDSTPWENVHKSLRQQLSRDQMPTYFVNQLPNRNDYSYNNYIGNQIPYMPNQQISSRPVLNQTLFPNQLPFNYRRPNYNNSSPCLNNNILKYNQNFNTANSQMMNFNYYNQQIPFCSNPRFQFPPQQPSVVHHSSFKKLDKEKSLRKLNFNEEDKNKQMDFTLSTFKILTTKSTSDDVTNLTGNLSNKNSSWNNKSKEIKSLQQSHKNLTNKRLDLEMLDENEEMIHFSQSEDEEPEPRKITRGVLKFKSDKVPKKNVDWIKYANPTHNAQLNKSNDTIRNSKFERSQVIPKFIHFINNLPYKFQDYVCMKRGSKVSEKYITEDNLSKILSLIKGHFRRICQDKFGNYFFQKLVKICDKQCRVEILKEIQDHFYEISSNQSGTHSLQTLILECLENIQEVNIIEIAICKNIVEMATDQFSNHVIQRFIDSVPENRRLLLNLKIQQNARRLIFNKYGSLIVSLIT